MNYTCIINICKRRYLSYCRSCRSSIIKTPLSRSVVVLLFLLKVCAIQFDIGLLGPDSTYGAKTREQNIGTNNGGPLGRKYNKRNYNYGPVDCVYGFDKSYEINTVRALWQTSHPRLVIVSHLHCVSDHITWITSKQIEHVHKYANGGKNMSTSARVTYNTVSNIVEHNIIYWGICLKGFSYLFYTRNILFPRAVGWYKHLKA